MPARGSTLTQQWYHAPASISYFSLAGIESIMSSFSSQPRVVVIGAMNLDVLATAGSTVRTDDSTPGRIRFTAGGVGRNIAEALARLSVDTHLYSCIGDDVAGNQLLQLCSGAGLDTGHVSILEDQPTPVYVAINSSAGALLHAVSDMSLAEQMNLDRFPGLPQDIADGDYCVVDANLSPDVLVQVAALCEHTPLAAESVSVGKCERLRPLLPVLDILKVNKKEAAQLAQCHDRTDVQALAVAVLQLGPKGVLMTLGSQGVLYATHVNNNPVVHMATAPDAKVKSVNGAGDALLGGFLVATLAGCDVPGRLQWGTASAHLSLESFSACSEQLSLQKIQEMSL